MEVVEVEVEVEVEVAVAEVAGIYSQAYPSYRLCPDRACKSLRESLKDVGWHNLGNPPTI